MVDWESGLAEYKKGKESEFDWGVGLAEYKKNKAQPIEPIESDAPEKNEIAMSQAIIEGVKNLPKSAANQVISVVDAIKNPNQTWEGLKTLSKDIYKNQMEVALKDMGFDPTKIKFEEGSLLENIEQTHALDAVVDDLEKAYGTYEGFKQTVAKDPARVIVDIGSIITPTAKGVESAALAAKMPGIATVAGKIAKGSALTEPITASSAAIKETAGIASKLIGKAFPKLAPTEMYKGATKMSTVLSEAERTKLAQIALDQEIPPTLKGLDKIDTSIQALDSKISDMIDTAESTGSRMPISNLFNEFDELKEASRLSGSGKESIRAINRVKNSIKESNLEIGRTELTPKQAQKIKQKIYKELESYYEKAKNSPAQVDAKKSVAKSAKQYLESLMPEIKQLNKNDGDLIALRRAIERPVSRISNRDITSALGAAGKSGAGALVGSMVSGPKAAGALATFGLVAGVLDDPVVKSKLAIIINKLQKQGANISTERAIFKLAAIEAAETLEAAKNDNTNNK